MDHSEFLETQETEEKSLSIGLATDPVQVLLTPHIGVIGVGGAGGNAVNNMIESNLSGISFFVANTDAQALTKSLATERIQLGLSLTRGLGAGANPEVGKMAAEESEDKIKEYLTGLHLLFITAGMGGGTGTGAAPVIARIAKEMGILTVGVVSKPFKFEGIRRMKAAETGTEELQKYVDTLILIPNQNLFRVIGDNTPMKEAFKMTDDVLCQGVRSITDLVMNPGLINLDFADVQTVIRQMGRAMMGTGEANGDNRALVAAEKAITNPLLDDSSIKGARSILINVSGGPDMTLQEVDIATERITAELAEDANIIFGTCSSEEDTGKIRISLIATGLPLKEKPAILQQPKKEEEPTIAVDAPFMPQPVLTEEPVEEQPALIQTAPSQAPVNISSSIVLGNVNVLTDVPENKEPPLLKEEQPILATPATVDIPVEVRPTIVEPKKKEAVSVKPYKTSLFDWLPGFQKQTEEKNNSSSPKNPSLEDDQFKLPEFLRTK